MKTKTVSAAAFNDSCTALRDSISSLVSCLTHEIPNEARILRNSIAEVEAMKLGRGNPLLEERRRNLLAHAQRVLTERVERYISSDIFENLAAAQETAQ